MTLPRRAFVKKVEVSKLLQRTPSDFATQIRLKTIIVSFIGLQSGFTAFWTSVLA